jgi:predicted XRE-type DNA-binding protein
MPLNMRMKMLKKELVWISSTKSTSDLPRKASKVKKNNDYEISSGNVFADLGLSNPEERLAKAELASQINDLIEQRNLSQTAAAKLLDIDQPKVSALSKGKLAGFSIERLFRFLNILDQDITIKITSKARSKKKAGVIIYFPKNKKPSLIKRPNISSNSTAVHARKRNK